MTSCATESHFQSAHTEKPETVDENEAFATGLVGCISAAVETLYFEAGAGRPLSLYSIERATESLANINNDTAEFLSKHSPEITASHELHLIVETYIRTTKTLLGFFRYLKQCLTNTGEFKKAAKEVLDSLKSSQDKEKADKKITEFLDLKAPFTELDVNLFDVCIRQQSLLKELNGRKTVKPRYFSIWKRIYRSMAVSSSVCSLLLISRTNASAILPAITLAMSVAQVSESVLVEWAETFEKRRGEHIGGVGNVVAAGDGAGGVQICEVGVLREKAKACSSELGVRDGGVVEEFSEAVVRMGMGLKCLENKVDEFILQCEKFAG